MWQSAGSQSRSPVARRCSGGEQHGLMLLVAEGVEEAASSFSFSSLGCIGFSVAGCSRKPFPSQYLLKIKFHRVDPVVQRVLAQLHFS